MTIERKERWMVAGIAAFLAPKSSKQEAHYQDHPKGLQHCGKCTMYRAPISCTAVIGRISPAGWCKYFRRKA